MYARVLTDTCNGVPVEVSGPSSCWSCAAVPTYWPETRTVGVPPARERLQTENSASGACGAHACHADTTAVACDQGQEAVKVATVETGLGLNRNEVAIPKLPPPPPRQAQNRSAFSAAEQTRALPSAVTIVSRR